MFTFLLSALAGASIGGSYVLLRTPRSGQENQAFIKDFIQTTKTNLDYVTEQASELEQSVYNLTNEIQNIQSYFLPDLMEVAKDFQEDVQISKRRIHDEMNEINRELDQFKS